MEKYYEDIFKEIIAHGAKMGEWSVLLNHYTEQPSVIGYTNEIHGYKVYMNDRHGIQYDWDFKSKRKALQKFKELVRFEFNYCVSREKKRLREMQEAEEAEALAKKKEALNNTVEENNADIKNIEELKGYKKLRGFNIKHKIAERQDNAKHVHNEVGDLVAWSFGGFNVEVKQH